MALAPGGGKGDLLFYWVSEASGGENKPVSGEGVYSERLIAVAGEPSAPEELSNPSYPPPGSPGGSYLESLSTFGFKTLAQGQPGLVSLDKVAEEAWRKRQAQKERKVWIKLLEQAGLLLEQKGLGEEAKRAKEEARKIRGCNAGVLWKMMECESCGRVQAVPVGRCGSRYCPECEAIDSRHKAKRAYARVKEFGVWRGEKPGGFPFVEFTVPDFLWDRFKDPKEVGRLMSVVRDSLREWYGVLREEEVEDKRTGKRKKKWVKKGDIAGLQTFHSWSSRKFPKFVPHVPVLLAGHMWRDGKRVRLRLYVKPWELRRLRRIYTRRMSEAFGFKREEVPTKDKLLNVYYGYVGKGGVLYELDEDGKYRKMKGGLMRRLQYMLRSPSPRRKVQGWKVLEGMSEEELRLALGHFDLRRKVRVVRWFGLWNGEEYKKLCEEFGVEPMAWREEPDYGRCPYCGGELVFKEWAISSPGREPEPVVVSALVRIRGPGS